MEEKKSIDVAREFLLKEKAGAAWLALFDINGLINYSELSRQYFNKSGNWLLQRLHGYTVNDKPATFKPHEYDKLIAALRDISKRLTKVADNIENAAPDED